MVATLWLALEPDEQMGLETSNLITPARPQSSISTAAVRQYSASADSQEPSRTKPASDPAFVTPAFASPQQIQQARELRERLRRKYLNRDGQHCALWCVGID